MNQYGPDKPCQRTACAEEPAHLGGEHVDPRSGRYDGPEVTFGALPSSVRRAARTLWRAGAPVPEIVDMAQEILRLRDQVAAVQVDRDRQVREAGRRSLDCEVHGQAIQDLERHVDLYSAQATRNDRGRIALLDLPHMLEELPADAKVSVVTLKKAARKALDAHGRAWK